MSVDKAAAGAAARQTGAEGETEGGTGTRSRSGGSDGGGGGSHGRGPGTKSEPNPLLLAAYNHHPRLRAPLVLARSVDDGASWRTFAVAEPAVPSLLQFSYPTMLAAGGRGAGGGGGGEGKYPYGGGGGGGEPYLYTAYSVMRSSRGSLTCYGIKVARVPMSGIPR